MQNDVSQPMEVVMIPIVGKVVDDGLVEFDLEALYKVQPELALELIRKMKGEWGDQWPSRHPRTPNVVADVEVGH